MLDSSPVTHQRSHGIARATLSASGALVDLFQKGSAKAILPRVDGDVPEVVFLNTSGGLTGGDTLSYTLSVADGGTAIAATQTAERAYASSAGAASVEVALEVGDAGVLYWFPQETILFNRASVERTTTVTLGQGARFLGIETLVLGRAHMKERLGSVHLRDARRMYHDGRLIHAEQVGLSDAVLADGRSPAGWQGRTVLASITYLGEDAEDRITAVRRSIADVPDAAASAWSGRLVIRMLADDSWRVRTALAPVLKHLGPGHLPRVWQS